MTGNRILPLLPAVLLLLLLVGVLSPAAQALETDLSGSTLQVAGGRWIYDGAPKTPSVTLTLNGQTLQEGVDYTLSYTNNIDAGTAFVTAVGTGNYSGSQTGSFSIQPKELQRSDFSVSSYSKTFDGLYTAAPTVTVSVLDGDVVTVSYAKAVFDSRFAGQDITMTISGLTLGGRDVGNYTLAAGLDTLTSSNGQILPQQPKFTTTATVAVGGAMLDLTSLVSGVRPDSLYATTQSSLLGSTLTGTIFTSGSTTGTVCLLLNALACDVNGDRIYEFSAGRGELTLTITQATTPQTKGADQNQDANGGNGSQKTLVDQPTLSIVVGSTVTYGKTLALSTTGGGGSGGVTYSVTPYTGQATVSSSGLLVPQQAGTVLVTARKAGDDQYNAAQSEPVIITIQPATITIQVKDKTAQVGDELPALSRADYTVTGLVGSDQLQTLPTLSYSTTPTMTKGETVSILASGAVVPAGGNYQSEIRYLSGQLTVAEKPLYPVTADRCDHGTLTVQPEAAAEKEEVTVTATPDEGYVLERLTVTGKDGSVPRLTDLGEGAYLFLMPAGEAVVTAVFAKEEEPVPEMNFTDVTQGQWYYEDVAYVYGRGLMKGTSDDLFSPTGTVTRGMLVTILYRLEGSPDAPASVPFSDVDKGQYYASPVAWAAWNGIVNGTTNTTFAPNAPVTREQLATILYRYAKYRDLSLTAWGDVTQFADLSQLSDYAWTAMTWANGAGLINGKDQNRLDPKGTATRAQCAAILHRFCEGFGL